MSEFPEWIERGIPDRLTYEESREIHRACDVIRRYVPDLHERMDASYATRWGGPPATDMLIGVVTALALFCALCWLSGWR